MDAVEWLMQWYKRQCNGVWEHDFGVSIESTDNPGWWVKIDVPPAFPVPRDVLLIQEGTPPREGGAADFSPEWLVCRVINGRFDGAGDPDKLIRIIGAFRNLVEGSVKDSGQPIA